MDPFHTKAKYMTAYVSIKHCTIQSFEHEDAKKATAKLIYLKVEDSLYLSHSVWAMSPIVLMTSSICNLLSTSASFVQCFQTLKDVYLP